jgi:hypothetical protein
MDDGNRPDFLTNATWFDKKILVANGTSTEVEIQKRPYTSNFQKILRDLNISSNHLGHWGRVNGPKLLEFEEVNPEFIRALGGYHSCVLLLLLLCVNSHY